MEKMASQDVTHFCRWRFDDAQESKEKGARSCGRPS
jgi:hypothetical protein